MNPPYRSMLQFQNQLSAPVKLMNLFAKPAPVSKNDTVGTKSDASADNVTSPDQATNPKKEEKETQKKAVVYHPDSHPDHYCSCIPFFSKMHTSSDNPSGTSTPKKTADATKEIYKQKRDRRIQWH